MAWTVFLHGFDPGKYMNIAKDVILGYILRFFGFIAHIPEWVKTLVLILLVLLAIFIAYTIWKRRHEVHSVYA